MVKWIRETYCKLVKGHDFSKMALTYHNGRMQVYSPICAHCNKIK